MRRAANSGARSRETTVKGLSRSAGTGYDSVDKKVLYKLRRDFSELA
jgi:hypothetical protein